MRESVGETQGNRSPGEMGLPPQSSGRGVFASRESFILLLGWSGSHRARAGPLGAAGRCLIIAQPIAPMQGKTGGLSWVTVQTSSQGQWGVGGDATEMCASEVIKSSMSLG